jgi:hypothetical protein
LLNGKQFRGNSIDTTGLKVLFEINKSAEKSKLKSFYRDELFSLTSNGNENVFFVSDPFYPEDYSVPDMRMVVYGKSDARYHYKTKWVIPTGLLVGAASAFLMEGSVFILLVPIAYTGIVQIPIVKIQKKSIASPAFIGNEYYKEGYNRSARSKRTMHALISSFAGIITGMLIYEIDAN